MDKYKGFISYAHDDNKEIEVANKFIGKFKIYAENHSINSWYDKDIPIASDWFNEIKKAMNECDFGIFLVSEYFINSEFIKEHEFNSLIELSKTSKVILFPVLLAHTNFESESIKSNWNELMKKQIFKFEDNSYFETCLNKDSGTTIHDRDKDYLFGELVNKIKSQIKELRITIESKNKKVQEQQRTLDKTNNIIQKPLNIQKTFNKANKLLDILYPWKDLKDETHGNIKYQYWECGKKDNPYYYLVLFPSTNAPVKAIEEFVSKIIDKQIIKPKSLLTVLKNSNINKSTLISLNNVDIKNKFLTYKDYYWEECVQPAIKDFKYGIDYEEYYIEQYVYDFYNKDNLEPVGKVSDIVMDYIDNDSNKPLLALIAQAGTGKTTFIEYIINKIDSKKQSQCIFISSEDIKEKYSNTKSLPNIKTIYDLYECSNNPIKFDKERLSMGVTNGSIIILIDGLEEIIAHFGNENKFDNEEFFSSLLSINNELGQCKVIVTSRELTETATEILNRSEVQIYKLKGFNNKLVDEYLVKRFKTKASMSKELSEKHIKKAKKYLAKINEKINNENKTIPYILDLICESIEEEFSSGKEELSFEIHEEYLSNHEIIDNVVYSYFFERELTRQPYPNEFESKDLAYIFMGLAVELGCVFSKEKLIEVIKLKYSTQYMQIVSNLEKAPLLKKTNDGHYKLKYDFLMNYFISLFLIQEFSGENTDYEISKVLTKIPEEIINDIKRYFNGSKSSLFMDNAKKIHYELLSNIEKNEELYKNAISKLIYLLVKVNSESLSAEKNTELLKELYSNKTNIFKNLYIYNKFVCLDLKDTEIWESEFNNFTNLYGSKFKNTKFLHCSFSNMKAGYNNEQIWDEISFDTCEMGDLKEVIDKKTLILSSKNIVKRILNDIKDSKYNIIKDENNYIDCLVEYEFIKLVGNSCRLQRKGKQFIKNGTITKKTKELFDCILKNNLNE